MLKLRMSHAVTRPSLSLHLSDIGAMTALPPRRIWNMSWNKPRIVEISLGAEINSYVCASSKK
ncbi:pyrroloquinoline quinone precursor peptide PqqA [Acidisoma cellulosilyticum]